MECSPTRCQPEGTSRTIGPMDDRPALRIIRAGEHSDEAAGFVAPGIAEATHAPTGVTTLTPQFVELLPGERSGFREHRGQEVLIAVLEGNCRIAWGPDDDRRAAAAGPGDFALVPPWTCHEESNPGPGTLVYALFDPGAGGRVL